MAPKVTEEIQQFKPLKVGGGGWLTGHDQHQDGTLVARADVYGAYIWEEAKAAWRQIVTVKSMPGIIAGREYGAGVFEIAIAPSNSNHIWMAWMGRIYRSTDKAGTFERTAFGAMDGLEAAMDANSGQMKLLSRKLAVDPFNENHVLASAGKFGLWRTTDGGKTWTRVAAVAEPRLDENGETPGVAGIIFDPKVKGRLFASSHGTGTYLSQDGGESFARLPGGPVNCVKDCDIAADGVLYAVEQGGAHIWRFDGEWRELNSEIASQEAAVVTCDPANAARVLFCNMGGSVVISQDGGETISPINWSPSTYSKADIPWHQIQDNAWLAVGAMTFDKTGTGELLLSMGIGFMRGRINGEPDAITMHWTYNTAGVEELVANQVIATPNGNLAVASWDRSFFRIENPDAFPDHYEGNWGETIVHGTAMDWCAQDPDVIGLVNFTLGSGVSRDGGRTFTRFASAPFAEFGQGGGGGEIAMGGPDNYVWAPTNKLLPQWTKDGGATWNEIRLPGVPDTDDGRSGINWGYFLKRHILAADRVAHGTFYIWDANAGVFVSRDGGETWASVHGGQLIQFGGYNAKMRAVPGHEGHLFATAGPQSGDDMSGDFRWSINGGKTWSNIDGLKEITDFGFGAAVNGYPVIWIVGFVNSAYGIYRSEDKCKSWIKVSAFPLDLLDVVVAIDGDKSVADRCYVGFGGSGYAYAPGTGGTTQVEPGFMMVPAAMLYRFGKRWSDLKTAHNAMEKEIAAALKEQDSANAATSTMLRKVKELIAR